MKGEFCPKVSFINRMKLLTRAEYEAALAQLPDPNTHRGYVGQEISVTVRRPNPFWPLDPTAPLRPAQTKLPDTMQDYWEIEVRFLLTFLLEFPELGYSWSLAPCFQVDK